MGSFSSEKRTTSASDSAMVLRISKNQFLLGKEHTYSLDVPCRNGCGSLFSYGPSSVHSLFVFFKSYFLTCVLFSFKGTTHQSHLPYTKSELCSFALLRMFNFKCTHCLSDSIRWFGFCHLSIFCILGIILSAVVRGYFL